MLKRDVIIMSGISGSGKDTYIQKHYPDIDVCSADDHFLDDCGGYHFDPSKLDEAHQACLRLFLSWIQDDSMSSPIVVNNTNLTSEEIAPYYAIAKAHNCNVVLVTIWEDPHLCAQRNLHGVGEVVCHMMNKRLKERRLPSFWQFDSVSVVTH